MDEKDDAVIVRGKGDSRHGMPERVYYIRLQYQNTGARDAEYGKELRFFPVIGSVELGYRQAERDSSYYVRYRAKVMHPAGDGKKIPANELLIQVPDGLSLESLVILQGKQIGDCREVSNAELGLTAKVFTTASDDSGNPLPRNSLLDDCVGELSLVVQEGPQSVVCRISNERRDTTFLGYDYFSDIIVCGPVPEVLHIYDFLQKLPQRKERGVSKLEYRNLAMSFI